MTLTANSATVHSYDRTLEDTSLESAIMQKADVNGFTFSATCKLSGEPSQDPIAGCRVRSLDMDSTDVSNRAEGADLKREDIEVELGLKRLKQEHFAVIMGVNMMKGDFLQLSMDISTAVNSSQESYAALFGMRYIW